jgi:hypothetical protein
MSPGIDSKDLIPQAGRAGTNSWFLVPIDCSKIPAQYKYITEGRRLRRDALQISLDLCIPPKDLAKTPSQISFI